MRSPVHGNYGVGKGRTSRVGGRSIAFVHQFVTVLYNAVLSTISDDVIIVLLLSVFIIDPRILIIIDVTSKCYVIFI